MIYNDFWQCLLWPYRAKIQFESNSQQFQLNKKAATVVALPGEDTIWKQLTTYSGLPEFSRELWPYRAKIQFESNSQLRAIRDEKRKSCGLTGRRYNLKATHNSRISPYFCPCVVALPGEDTIWKQLTTAGMLHLWILMLWPYRAKIQFESNSQQFSDYPWDGVCCGLTGRRYNLKATHNKTKTKLNLAAVVALPGEDTIWKQLTTRRGWGNLDNELWPYRAKIQFESNSQHAKADEHAVIRCGLTGRRYNLKATHNIAQKVYKAQTLWPYRAKIQFESNSQQVVKYLFTGLVVALPGEDTIWKQLTTMQGCPNFPETLWPYRAKIQFESNSQRASLPAQFAVCCGLTGRRYNLKATHNYLGLPEFSRDVVALPGEDTIWKQLTTTGGLSTDNYSCGLTGRRYNLKATHNAP